MEGGVILPGAMDGAYISARPKLQRNFGRIKKGRRSFFIQY